MKRKLAFIIMSALALSLSVRISAQENNQNKSGGNFSDRLITGGNIGLQFGTVTLIDISPIIGYKITDKFVAGIGIKYQYESDRRFVPTLKTSTYGGSIFSRYYIWDNVYLHAEYEFLNLEPIYVDYMGNYYVGSRMWIGSPLAGAGYRQAIGEKASFDILILFNFNETQYTPYNNPIIRVGFSLGI
jgi:hypothetical protein